MFKIAYYRDIYLIGIYRLQNGDIQIFIDFLENLISNIRLTSLVEIVILQDVNINSKKNDNANKLYKEFLKRSILYNIIASDTHFDNDEVRLSASDHFLT